MFQVIEESELIGAGVIGVIVLGLAFGVLLFGICSGIVALLTRVD